MNNEKRGHTHKKVSLARLESGVSWMEGQYLYQYTNSSLWDSGLNTVFIGKRV